MVLGNYPIAAFVASSDLPASLEFYLEKLGLSFKYQDEYAAVLDAHGTTLRIQKVDNVEPHAYTTLGWISDDVEGTVTELASRGIHFEIYPWMEQDERGIASFPGGSRVAWFKDPDGNLLSISGA